MADLEKTVKIIFAGEDKALNAAIDNVSKKFGSLSSVADTLSAPLARAADGVLKLDAALAALAIGGMALAIKESSEFNSGFALISTSIDATGKDLEEYRKAVLAYSANSAKSLADINSALYTAAQAGVAYGESLQFMSEAEKLAVANNANLNTTVDLLTGTMNAYGFKVESLAHINDVFFTSTLIGKQTIDELGASMGQVVGIAANFGVSFEELSGAISTLTAKGMDTANAITAVKGMITAMASPSAEAVKAARQLGIEFSVSALKAEGFGGMLAKVMAATGGNAEQMVTLFSEVRALNGAMQITGDGMEFFNKAMATINTSAGSAEEAYKKMVVTFENQTQMMINSAKGLMISIGSELEPMGAAIAGSFGGLLKGITAAVEGGAFDPLFDLLSDASTQLGQWIADVAKILPEALKGLDFSKLLDALKSLGAAFGEYFGDIDLTQVEDLHDFIQLLIDGIAGLVKVTTGMVDTFRPFFTAIADFLVNIAKSDEETQKMMGTLMGFGKLIQSTSLAFVAAVQVIDRYGVSIEGIFKTVTGGAQIMWNGLTILWTSFLMLLNTLEKAWLHFLNLMSMGALQLLPSFRKSLDEVEARGHQLRDSLIEDGMDAAAGLDKMVDGFKKLGGEAEDTAAKVKDATKTIADIPDRKVTTWEFEYGESFKKAIDDISKEFVQVAEDAQEQFDDIEVGVQTELDLRTVDGVVYLLGEAIPEEKKVDVSLDTSKVAAQSEIIKGALEWRAKLDITEAQEKTNRLKIMFESIGQGFESTGDVLKSLYSQLGSAGRWAQDIIMDQIKAERAMREEQLALQKSLIETEIEYNRAKTEAMQSGQDFMIKIEAQGLEPHLEAFMWKILENIQIRGNAQAAEFLLGWNAGGAG